MAVSTDFVAYHLGIAWVTSRSLLMNMALKGLIEMEKTTKSMIFRLPKVVHEKEVATPEARM